MSGTLALDDLAGALAPVVRAEFDRIATGVIVQTLAAEAAMLRDRGPVVLAHHERQLLAALEWGDDTDAYAGLEARHFACPSRGAMWAALRELRAATPAGAPVDRAALRASLLARHPHGAALAVDRALYELDTTPADLGVDLAAAAREVIMAAAWSDFAADVRTLHRLAQAGADRGAWFDGPALLARLDALRAALAGVVGA